MAGAARSLGDAYEILEMAGAARSLGAAYDIAGAESSDGP